jgi:hypothetical protein
MAVDFTNDPQDHRQEAWIRDTRHNKKSRGFWYPVTLIRLIRYHYDKEQGFNCLVNIGPYR